MQYFVYFFFVLQKHPDICTNKMKKDVSIWLHVDAIETQYSLSESTIQTDLFFMLAFYVDFYSGRK